MNHDVKLGNMIPEKSLTYPRRNALAHFIGFIDYVFPEVMLGDLASGELNDMFEELSPQKTATVFIIVNNIIGALSHKRFVEPNI
jgi:hypothetical protein